MGFASVSNTRSFTTGRLMSSMKGDADVFGNAPDRIRLDEVALMDALVAMSGEAFNDMETCTGHRPRREYLQQLLGSDYFIALAAIENDQVIGGIAAYELRKFEEECSGIYIYAVGVAKAFARFQAPAIWRPEMADAGRDTEILTPVMSDILITDWTCSALIPIIFYITKREFIIRNMP